MKRVFNLVRVNIFFTVIFIIILSAFILLQPKVSAFINPVKSSDLLSAFLTEVKRSGKVDAQKYWQFREFYSPGSFVFNRKETPFLIFNSLKLHSTDSLVSTALLPDYSTSVPINSRLLGKYENTTIYENGGEYFLFFILPVAEMKMANGYFDYGEKDKELVKDKYWLNVTEIKK